MNATSRDPMPLGLALLAFGIGVAAFTFLSISADDVSYARTQWTALLALVLAAPAILLYILTAGPLGSWWRAFWTVAAAAYLLHFWWAIIRAYHGDFSAVVARQGWVAYTNFAVTLLWALDAVSAWIRRDWLTVPRIVWRFVTWAGVTVSLITAAAIFRTGTVQVVGCALALLVILALLVRFFRPLHPRRFGTA